MHRPAKETVPALRIASSLLSLPLALVFAQAPLLARSAPALAGAGRPISALAFDIEVRVSFRVHGGGHEPQQTMSAHVEMEGNKGRIESRTAGQTAVVLLDPPYLYRLLPQQKAGVRWKMPPRAAGLGAFDPAALVRNPASVRQALMQQGAHLTGTARLNGVPVQTWSASGIGGAKNLLLAWLRRSDGLPLRMDSSSPSLNLTATWKNYQRPRNLTPAHFLPPAGYAVRDADGRAPISAF